MNKRKAAGNNFLFAKSPEAPKITILWKKFKKLKFSHVTLSLSSLTLSKNSKSSLEETGLNVEGVLIGWVSSDNQIFIKDCPNQSNL
jgi:hypothetical protein